MAKNYYFENYGNSMEQTLIEDLVIESIRIYGIDVWYLPRTLVAKDDLLNEDDLSAFNEAYLVEMYIKSVDGFEGEGDFLSKFGLQIRDSVTMTLAQRVYELEIGVNTQINRPREGDLIYLPLNRKFFEIQHVEHEAIFYQMGSLQTYDLRAELFEYSGERFNTGEAFLDQNFESVDTWQDSTEINYIVEVRNGVFNLKNSVHDIAFSPQPALELYAGQHYIFDVSHASNAGKIMQFYTTNSQSTGIPITTSTGTFIRTGTAGTFGATLKLSIPISSTIGNTFYYICATSLGMGNTIKVLESKLNVESYDAFADNKTIETIADSIIDFTHTNPFGEDNF
jgi:hypothetical protein